MCVVPPCTDCTAQLPCNVLWVCLLQVSAQTGHRVVVVDMTDELLRSAQERIKTSLKRVAKKKFSDDEKVSMATFALSLSLSLSLSDCVHVKLFPLSGSAADG